MAPLGRWALLAVLGRLEAVDRWVLWVRRETKDQQATLAPWVNQGVQVQVARGVQRVRREKVEVLDHQVPPDLLEVLVCLEAWDQQVMQDLSVLWVLLELLE